jgi:arylmalonate decarboxylase
MARKRRIGIVVPTADDRVSPEGPVMYPDVEFIARGTGVTSMTPQGYDDAVDKILPAAGHLAREDVEAVMLMGTSLTFYRGKDFHDELLEKARAATGGLPVSTMSQAVVDGLRAVGARRIAVATAKNKPVNDALAPFLAANDIETLALESFGITTFNGPGGAQSKTEEDILDLAGAAVARAPGADGILVSCGGLRTLNIAAPLERRHGLPVVTSTQSAFWTAVRLIGESGRLDGYGRMLAA